MAGVKTAVKVNDGMSSALKSMNKALELVIRNFDSLQKLSGNAVDVAEISEARQELHNAANAINEIENNLREAEHRQKRFNDSVDDGNDYMNKLQSTIGKTVAVIGGMAVIRKVTGFITDCTDAFDTQLNSANQLRNVLVNMTGEGAEEAFNAINRKASEIQSKGIYGDEAMLAGAAELATYFEDANAITMMMDTLSDYVAGMTGGGAVDTKAMVDYATGLGKIMVGSYEAMTKKGFEFTDTQKAIIEGTATEADIVKTLGKEYLDMSEDMRSAAVISQVIGESWEGLYETMSDTPQGKIIALKNAWGDVQERVAVKLYPALIKLIEFLEDHLPEIEELIMGIVVVLEFVFDVIGKVMNFVSDNKEFVIAALGGIAAATLGWRTAQLLLNTAMNANPIFLLITAIASLIIFIYQALTATEEFELKWLQFCDTVITAIDVLHESFHTILQDFANMFGYMGEAFGIGFEVTWGDDAIAKNNIKQAERKKEIEEKKAEIERLKAEAEKVEDPFAEYYAKYSDLFDKIGGDTSDISDDTDKIADALEITEEDLKYLRDIAEKEAINRFTTAEIKIDMQNNNNISSDMDIDGIVTQLEDRLYESMTIAAEGVY